MFHWTLAGVDAFPAPPKPDGPGYDYSILIEGWVRTRQIYIHRVGSNGRVRESVRDRYGRRLEFSTDADMRDFHEVGRVELADMPGRFAFVARDEKGKVRGRRDFWISRSEEERAEVVGANRPSPMEELEQARDAEKRSREAAQQALDAAQAEIAAREKRIAQLEAKVASQAARLRRSAARAAAARGAREPRHPAGTPRSEAERPRSENPERPRASDSQRRMTKAEVEAVRDLLGDVKAIYRFMRSTPDDPAEPSPKGCST